MGKKQKPRIPEAEVASIFLDRWSPRAFLSTAIAENTLKSLLEAARWAPSCFNEQPWLFVYAKDAEEKENFLSALVEQNRAWAKNAPLLMFLCAKRRFDLNQKENRHAVFDCGAAWMALAIQARKLGLYAHAMAGFKKEKAYKVTRVEEKNYDIIAVIALGKKGNPEILPPDLKKIEFPNQRKPLSEIYHKGGL